MTATIAIAALWFAFGATHLILSSQTVRPRLIEKVGAQPFQGLYSLVALAIFVPMVWIYFENQHAGPLLWYGGQHLALRYAMYVGMAISLALVVGGFVTQSPAMQSKPGAETAVRGVLRVTRHPVVMGMGLATLLPETGKAAIVTDDVPGITISSLMVDAGPQHSPVLIQIGDIDARKDHSENPTTLHDVFCRVGGAVAGSADACLIVNSNDVIIDHTWLWRADHGAGAEWAVNRSKNGLVVNGDDVTIFGLFNEHFQEYQTVWKGERGRVYFYQSEIPYDPPSHEAWRSGSREGYASYKVAEHVQVHEAHGLGIYSFFRPHQEQNPELRLKSAIEVPETKDVRINHVSIFSGRSGGIDHAINRQGEATNVGELKHFDGINSESLR